MLFQATDAYKDPHNASRATAVIIALDIYIDQNKYIRLVSYLSLK